MSAGHILVVDDEPQIRRVMRTTLVAQGYEVSDARTGEDAFEQIRSERFDLILLDMNMPGISGLETCREIRAGSDLPIIMVTVRGSERDKVQALDAGADGYITKPFEVSELLARIRAILRRTCFPSGPQSERLQLGDVEIDFEARRVNARGEQIRLTTKEFDLLTYLAAHAGKTHRMHVSHCSAATSIGNSSYSETTRLCPRAARRCWMAVSRMCSDNGGALDSIAARTVITVVERTPTIRNVK